LGFFPAVPGTGGGEGDSGSPAVDSGVDATGDSALGSTGHSTWEDDADGVSGAACSVFSGYGCF